MSHELETLMAFRQLGVTKHVVTSAPPGQNSLFRSQRAFNGSEVRRCRRSSARQTTPGLAYSCAAQASSDYWMHDGTTTWPLPSLRRLGEDGPDLPIWPRLDAGRLVRALPRYELLQNPTGQGGALTYPRRRDVKTLGRLNMDLDEAHGTVDP